MVENITKVKSGIMPNVDVSVKNIYVKKIVFGILLRQRNKNYSKKYNL